jgi:hypothetical protein
LSRKEKRSTRSLPKIELTKRKKENLLLTTRSVVDREAAAFEVVVVERADEVALAVALLAISEAVAEAAEVEEDAIGQRGGNLTQIKLLLLC